MLIQAVFFRSSCHRGCTVLANREGWRVAGELILLLLLLFKEVWKASRLGHKVEVLEVLRSFGDIFSQKLRLLRQKKTCKDGFDEEFFLIDSLVKLHSL